MAKLTRFCGCISYITLLCRVTYVFSSNYMKSKFINYKEFALKIISAYI